MRGTVLRLFEISALCVLCSVGAAQGESPFDEDDPLKEPVGISAKSYPRLQGKAKRMVDSGITWLLTQQRADGSFPAKYTSGQDVGITALVVMACAGNGVTYRDGGHKKSLTRAVEFLMNKQDRKSGLIGAPHSHAFLYNHALATLALGEQYWMYRSPILRAPVTNGVAVIERARNPDGAWRYNMLPNGDNDTSVTAWMVTALKMAERGGIEVDGGCYAGALDFIDEMTDQQGRVGYNESGSWSSRSPQNEHYPKGKGEAMTAAGMYMNFLLDEQYRKGDEVERQSELLLQKSPEWEEGGLGMDFYYWHWGSRALARVGGREARAWRKALEQAARKGQESKGELEGSWDPVGPWGYHGGRVYATAMFILALEAEVLEKE